jgi:hypothetical protein
MGVLRTQRGAGKITVWCLAEDRRDVTQWDKKANEFFSSTIARVVTDLGNIGWELVANPAGPMPLFEAAGFWFKRLKQQ